MEVFGIPFHVRSALDSCRTLLVWVFELLVGWSSFQPWTLLFWFKPMGFAIIVVGTMIYFNTIKIRRSSRFFPVFFFENIFVRCFPRILDTN